MTKLSVVGDSAKNLTTICPFIVQRGLYMISCSPSLIAHLAKRPKFSGFGSTCLVGCSVRTHIEYLRKYRLNHRATCTR